MAQCSNYVLNHYLDTRHVCHTYTQSDVIHMLVIVTILVPVHTGQVHDDVIKWKHFPRYWPFVRGTHRWPVNPPHKGQWRGALVFSLICAWINGWVNYGNVGDLRRHRIHYDVTLMHWNSVETMYTSIPSMANWPAIGFSQKLSFEIRHQYTILNLITAPGSVATNPVQSCD